MKYLISLQTVLCFTYASAQKPIHEMDINLIIKHQDSVNLSHIGKEYEQFFCKNDKGITYSNKNFAGQKCYINFWFESCYPCMLEFDALNELSDSLLKKDIGFITFTFESEEAIKKIREKYKVRFTIISITKDECSRLNYHNGFPTHIILNESGNVSFIHSGGATTKEGAQSFVFGTLYPKLL